MASISPEQGSLAIPIVDALSQTKGLVRREDLQWQEFDPKKPLNMLEYVGEIGLRMADSSRESKSTDTLFELYGRDFARAEPSAIKKGLYFPRRAMRGQIPEKSVVRVGSERRVSLRRREFPGMVRFSTGVAVPEDLYEDIVVNAPFMSNKVFNKIQRANKDNPNVEEVENLAGEAVYYMMSDKNELLEDWDKNLLEARADLTAVRQNINFTNRQGSVEVLEPYHQSAQKSIHGMVHASNRGHGYGTNEATNTHMAVMSNIYRSNRPDWLKTYVQMAIDYNDAVRGKIDQSQQAIFTELARHREYLIRNIDRVYED